MNININNQDGPMNKNVKKIKEELELEKFKLQVAKEEKEILHLCTFKTPTFYMC